MIDADRDLVADEVDNCPGRYNPGQVDSDGDRTGDDCDTTPGSVPGDLSGDGLSDVISQLSKTIRISLSSIDGLGTGQGNEISSGGARFVSYGNTDAEAGDELIGLSKSGGQWLWSTIDARLGGQQIWKRFGASNQTPLLGCHSNSVLIPAVMTRDSRSGGTRVSLGTASGKVLFLPRGVSRLTCSRDRSGSSLLIGVASVNGRNTLRGYSLAGHLRFTTESLPGEIQGVISLPASGAMRAAYGALVIEKNELKIYLVGVRGGKFAVLPTGIRTRGVAGFQVGSDTKGGRWILIALTDGSERLIKFADSSITKLEGSSVDLLRARELLVR